MKEFFPVLHMAALFSGISDDELTACSPALGRGSAPFPKAPACSAPGRRWRRVIQHEYDHIEGVVFTDRIAPLRRQLLKSKLLNLAKGKYRCAYKTR